MAPKAKKYKLFSNKGGDGGGPPACAFYGSAEGCKSGDNCKFLHVDPSAPSHNKKGDTQHNIRSISASSSSSSSSSSAMSSESSESEDEEPVFEWTPPTPVTSAAKKRKSRTNDVPDDVHVREEHVNISKKKKQNNTPKKQIQLVAGQNPFLFDLPSADTSTPKAKQEQNQQESNKKKKQKKESTEKVQDFRSLVSDLPTAAVITEKKEHTSEKKKKKRKEERNSVEKKYENTPDFRSLISDLPIAAFSTEKTPVKEKREKRKTPIKEEKEEDSDDSSAPKSGLKQYLPERTPEGYKWKDLVIKTRQHPSYARSFDFESCKEKEGQEGRGWVRTQPFGKFCQKNPQVIAIDCEMVGTKDPKTGKIDDKALCRLSVVNGVNPEEVLLDTLVKPDWPVTHHRTFVNGVTFEDLMDVKFTLRHAQAFMLALCSEETVIIGHAVHNDLIALKMEHFCIVDSSFLFKVKDAPENTFSSLKDAAMCLLKKEMPKTHDSVNDARTALECLEIYRKADGNIEPIISSRKKNENCLKLFVHRIPKGVKEEHLSAMFLHITNIKPSSVEEIEYPSSKGKTYVHFTTERHANLAFDSLEGTAAEDAIGLQQKNVYLKNKDYVRVRKMAVKQKRNYE